jgi:hypothetical protein
MILKAPSIFCPSYPVIFIEDGAISHFGTTSSNLSSDIRQILLLKPLLLQKSS